MTWFVCQTFYLFFWPGPKRTKRSRAGRGAWGPGDFIIMLTRVGPSPQVISLQALFQPVCFYVSLWVLQSFIYSFGWKRRSAYSLLALAPSPLSAGDIVDMPISEQMNRIDFPICAIGCLSKPYNAVIDKMMTPQIDSYNLRPATVES